MAWEIPLQNYLKAMTALGWLVQPLRCPRFIFRLGVSPPGELLYKNSCLSRRNIWVEVIFPLLPRPWSIDHSFERHVFALLPFLDDFSQLFMIICPKTSFPDPLCNSFCHRVVEYFRLRLGISAFSLVFEPLPRARDLFKWDPYLIFSSLRNAFAAWPSLRPVAYEFVKPAPNLSAFYSSPDTYLDASEEMMLLIPVAVLWPVWIPKNDLSWSTTSCANAHFWPWIWVRLFL